MMIRKRCSGWRRVLACPGSDLSYSLRVGSLRNPVGPLPSSIYWRRRAVALSVAAVLVLLAVWAANWAGSDNAGSSQGKGPEGAGPAETITPGPSSSGPAISQRPGGRDESGNEDGGSGGTGGAGADDDGAGGDDDGGADGVSGGAGGQGSGGGAGAPVGASLPDCTAGAVRLSVRSVKNSYGLDEKPTFEIVARNSSDKTCKVEFGPKAAVMTITFADDDDPMWTSGDCPAHGGRTLLQVPAKGQNSRTLEWDRKPSAPNCTTPSGGSAKPGTYLVEVQAPGLPTARVSFSLAKD
jgi:hypothetical protein